MPHRPCINQPEPQLTSADAESALMQLADPKQAASLRGYFKTGPGGYSEGDQFLGLRVPQVRLLAKSFRTLARGQALRLLRSPYNEARLLALLILVEQYKVGDETERARICRDYLKHRHRVNNWNLVDSSAPYLLGPQVNFSEERTLDGLAGSASLWDRRIAVVATLALIRAGDFACTLTLCQRLLNDPEDLIHKACGWMLREVGKKDQSILKAFLDEHHPQMPRTMLRYAIERLPDQKRNTYLTAPSNRRLAHEGTKDTKKYERQRA
jgi:3-methyladenine DNA glycosylase AlkD